jgi:hypothetical protein
MELVPATDEEIRYFLTLQPQEQFASIVADLVAQYGFSTDDFPVTESLRDGLYTREVFIPKGSIVVGALHKLPSVNVCLQGHISILATDGSRYEICAPFQSISPAHSAKIGYALEDTRWLNVFSVKSESLDTVRDEIAFSDTETIRLLDPESRFFTKEITWQR